ncbi:tRNA dihydrouridine synthase DUS3 [Pneumocystis jirovecii RU7]|uniref:tRNA-dihydrouridine(47) synthase [NAD(P)(+)] n=1 Tax=Pneumocystis jirovecii (strain RU7) TaxID=1408657 RepID=A0A0W4ZGI2_PNEJ7|nr:tRNA dihydrouridine synthase DUS3 [Pneumocystis jirovecii RU7]KTW27488.1 hypothetical protein T551_02987 [Pneumocystis jirovecii RU7]
MRKTHSGDLLDMSKLKNERNNIVRPGIAMIKPEYLKCITSYEKKIDELIDKNKEFSENNVSDMNDFSNSLEAPIKKRKKQRGQNKNRKIVLEKEIDQLCPYISADKQCQYGEDCKFSHSIEDYLSRKPDDIGKVCSVFDAKGWCASGWRCRWLNGHVLKPSLDTKTWRLIVDDNKAEIHKGDVLNKVSADFRKQLSRKLYLTPKSSSYLALLDEKLHLNSFDDHESENIDANTLKDVPVDNTEKKRICWKDRKILAPLTTVGNIPFRRICCSFGADVTYSEMIVSLPLLQGSKSEWALPRAHISERSELRNGRRGLFGAQICGSKLWQSIKATEVLANVCNEIDFIDLNCGCPIDLIYKQGAGSALLDSQTKMIKMLGGMTYVSNSIPITTKIRMGTKDSKPTAIKLISKLRRELNLSAVVLHARSRQQRYTKKADWEYIRQCASMISAVKKYDAYNEDYKENSEIGNPPYMAFIGNGDIYSWEDWEAAMASGVDTAMIARGALIKPWIFEEIESKKYIDKTSSQRLDILRQFCEYGLDYWGSDDFGVNTTRRFLCEFLSFFHRYVPVTMLEVLPPNIQDRPLAWQGRNELETLLASENSEDWVKISEMFLGKVKDNTFKFIPKHKSNSYEIEAEG